MLIAVSIALGSLSLVGHTSLLFAALASLAVLTERIYSHITGAFSDTAYTQAGLLGGLVLCTRPARASPRPARRESEQLWPTSAAPTSPTWHSSTIS